VVVEDCSRKNGCKVRAGGEIIEIALKCRIAKNTP